MKKQGCKDDRIVFPSQKINSQHEGQINELIDSFSDVSAGGNEATSARFSTQQQTKLYSESNTASDLLFCVTSL